MVTINGIPVYRALLLDDASGMQRISLVDSPAVMTDFVALAEKQRPVMFAVTDAEKRLVRGVVMRADFPIYRYSKEDGEYYIIYKAEDIRLMAEKYLADGNQNNVNLMHEAGSDVEGVQMVQYFIKDSENGISPAGFEDITDGSLFAEFHVHNDEVWEQIKDGTYKGFSLEGYFDLRPEQDKQAVKEAVNDLNEKGQKFNKTMSKLERLKQMITAAFVSVQCGSVTTDKGVIYWEGDEDLKAGDAVFVDVDGAQQAAEDGDYVTDDKKTIVVVDGKVSEITDPEAEVEGTEETTETEVTAGEAKMQRMQALNQRRVELEESFDEKMTRISEAFRALLGDRYYLIEAGENFAIVEQYDEEYINYAVYRYAITITDEAVTIDADSKTEVERAWVEKGSKTTETTEETTNAEEVEQLRSENEQLRAELEQLKKQPLAKPAEQELEASAQPIKTGNKRLDNLARIVGAKR
jgi:hypothetical protein